MRLKILVEIALIMIMTADVLEDVMNDLTYAVDHFVPIIYNNINVILAK